MASSTAAARRVALPHTGRRERHRTEIRERLFRSALRLFAERGYLETTVEDITEAADVGKGTFFNYFQTKEHVLATFGAERIAAIERARERATKGPVLAGTQGIGDGPSGSIARKIPHCFARFTPHTHRARPSARNSTSGFRTAASCWRRFSRSHRNAARCGATFPPPSWRVWFRLRYWASLSPGPCIRIPRCAARRSKHGTCSCPVSLPIRNAGTRRPPGARGRERRAPLRNDLPWNPCVFRGSGVIQNETAFRRRFSNAPIGGCVRRLRRAVAISNPFRPGAGDRLPALPPLPPARCLRRMGTQAACRQNSSRAFCSFR